MKSSRKNPFHRAIPLRALTAFLLVSPLSAGTVYWDTNSTTAGSGNIDGIWDAATTNWGDAAGTGTTAIWTAGDTAAFAAGADFAGTRIVTVSGTQVTAGILVDSEVVNLTLTGGTLDFGALQGSINTSAWGTTSGKTFTLNSVLTGTNGLTIASNGDMSATGGTNSSVTKLGGTNTFTGDVTITSGLVAYGSNAAFGNSANKIILNGGGLLDANTSTALSRDIQVLSGGGTFRNYGSSNATWSGAITGSGTINRTDGGTLTHSGDLSGYSGTYNVQGGTTQLTGTAATIGGNWTVASGTTLTINSTAAQTLNGTLAGAGSVNINSTSALTLGGSTTMTGTMTVNGLATLGSGSSVNMGTGGFNINGTGIATIGSGATLNADTIALTGTTSNQLNIQSGATVTTKYFNIGNAGNNSGRVVQTGGNVTINTGGFGMRIGHWNNGANAGSLYNLSGGTLNASAIAVTIGHDGQGDMIVGGGAGTALFQASSIQLDANGNGGGSGAGDMTLTVSANGTVEVGAGGIGAAAAGDRVILNGGTMKAVGNATWGSVFNANPSATSEINANNLAITLTNNITGAGTINLSSATGSVIFNTGGSQTVEALLSGSTPISKTGAGSTTLSGVGSTYSGTITVNDGRLNLGGTTTSNISLVAAKTLGGEGTTTGVVTLNGGFLSIDPTTAGKLTVANLNLTGTNAVRFDVAPAIAGGAFNVLSYTGSLTGVIGTNLVLENAAKYRNSTLVDTSGGVTLDIQSKNLVWNGTTGGQWDTLTSARWNALEVDQFAWGDAVTFDNTGVATTIAITGELQPASITVAGTKNYTINGGSGNFISGLAGIAKSGSSTLLLNAPNTFSGANTITEGTVQVGDGTNNTATLGTGAAAISGGASLVHYRNGGYTLNNSISGAGTLAFRGTGVSGQSDYTLGGNNSGFSGTLDIRSGARVGVDNVADVGTSAIVVNDGGQLFLSNATLSNNISLAGNGWTESAGQLGAVRFSGATLSGGVTLTGNARLTTWGSDTGSITGVITDGASSFGITKTGTGTLTLTNANTYDSGTTISFGSLNIRTATSLGSGNVIIGDSGTSTNAASLYLDTNRTTFAKQVTVSSFGTGTATLGSRATVTGSGDNNQFTNIVLQRDVTFDSNAADRTDYENISGLGNITVAGVGRTVFITNNTYTGNLTVSVGIGGNLQIGAATAGNQNYIPDTASVTVNDTASNTLAEFRLSVGGETIGGLNGNGTIDSNAINTTLTVGANNLGGTFSGVIQNGGANTVALTKIGTGTQILSGANTTTGTFTVNGGLLRLNNTAAVSGGLAATGGTAALTVNGGVLGLGASDLLRGLGTGVTQVQVTGGASGFSAHTANRTVNFGGAAATVTWGSATFNPSTLVLSHSTADANLIIANPIDLGTTARTIQVDNGTAVVDAQLSGALSNTGGITKTGLGTLSLSGTNTAFGAFTLSAGGLVLDYSNNTSKLSDASVLTFGAGTTSLDLAGGSHTEVVLSTALSANAFANITRSSGTSVLQLGTITVGAGSSLNLGAENIASTNNTNTNGILGTWATIGSNWAVNSTNGANGLITAYTGYTDVVRLTGTKTITSATASNIRIIEGSGSLANITMAASGITNINTLNQTATGGTTTVAIGTGNTLRLGTAGGVLAGSGVGRLDITGGTLTAGGNAIDTAGSITFNGATANTVSISSVIANNGTGAVSLVKSGTGTLILNAANTFTGGTAINAGIVAISAMGGGSPGGNVAGFGTGAVTVNSGGTAWIHGNSSSFGTVANAWTLGGGTLHIEDGATTFSGLVSVTSASTIQERWGDTITFSNIISGAGTLTFQRSASGTSENPVFLLSGNNTITAAITAGANATVRLGHANALGTTAGGTTVASGGVLDLNGLTIGAEAVSLSGTGISSGGALINSNATTAASLSGAITLAANSSVGGAGNATFSGAIGGAGFGLTKVGAGTVTLSGANTYNGATTVSAGRLTISNTNASQITVAGTATLGGTGSTTGTLTTNASSTIALNGATPTSGLVVSGAVNFSGSTALTFDAVPNGVGTISHRVVTYGTLVSGISNLTTPAGYRAATVTNDTANSRVLLTVTTGTRTWNQTAPATWALQTSTNFVEGDQQFASGDAVVFDDTAANGAVTLAGTLLPGSVTVNNTATAYTFSGAGSIGGTNGLTKSATGTLSITNANSYAGATAINGGVVNIQHANALGSTAAGTTVASGAALEIQGGITTAAEALTLNGTGISPTSGALRNVSGNNTYAGTINLATASTIYSETGTTLTTSGLFTLANTLTKTGGGTLKLTNYNGSTAAAASDFVVNAGTLEFGSGYFNTSPFGYRALAITVNSGGILRTTAAHALGGDNIDGGTSWGQVRLIGGEWNHTSGGQYVSGGTVSGGEGRLVLQGGTITGAGDLRMLGSTITTLASATTSTISNAGGVNLQFGGVTFDVAEGAATTDLLVSNVISSTNGVIKSGTGLASFSGNNSYAGSTTISTGTLEITHNSALGTTAAGTTVASGATLQLSNNITIGAETLGLSGSGVSNGGALRNISGDNTYGGTITLNAASRIHSDAGTLTIDVASGNAITATDQNLTFSGAGNITVADAIATGTGTLTKDDAGTLTLSGNNSYTGTTSVNQGTLRINGNNSGTGLVTVAAGATLGGTGTISGAVNVTGVLSPGASIESLATGTLSFVTGSSLDYEASFADSNLADLLDINGDLNLAGTITLGLGNADLANSNWVIGTKLAIASYTGSWNSGTFDGYADASTHLFGVNEWRILYADNTPGVNFTGEQAGSFVTLTLIPEPSSAILGGIGALLLLRRRRR